MTPRCESFKNLAAWYRSINDTRSLAALRQIYEKHKRKCLHCRKDI